MHILLFNEQKANVFLSKTWGLLLPKARSDPTLSFSWLGDGSRGHRHEPGTGTSGVHTSEPPEAG